MKGGPAPRPALMPGPNLPGRARVPPGRRDLLGRQCLGRCGTVVAGVDRPGRAGAAAVRPATSRVDKADRENA